MILKKGHVSIQQILKGKYEWLDKTSSEDNGLGVVSGWKRI